MLRDWLKMAFNAQGQAWLKMKNLILHFRRIDDLPVGSLFFHRKQGFPVAIRRTGNKKFYTRRCV